MEARALSSTGNLNITPIAVRGGGASAVAMECFCRGGEVQGRFVGKFFRQVPQTKQPSANAMHEFEMLEATRGCPNIVKALGVFHLPSTGSLRQILGFVDVPGMSPWDSLGSLESQMEKRQAQGICALFMEKCDYALQDFDLFHFTEREAAFVCRSVLTALRHLHALDIVHRDVKPGNILIGSSGDQVKLGDFGLACKVQVDTGRVENSRCGTHGFLAPECLIDHVFCKESDVFAVGAVLYQLLFRTYAFIKGTHVETDIATMSGHLPLIPCGKPVGKSDESCHLLRWLLEHRATKRPTAAAAFEHPWLQKDQQETLRSFVQEQDLRNDDLGEVDLDPVRHHFALGRSQQFESSVKATRTATTSSRVSMAQRFAALGSRALGPFQLLRRAMGQKAKVAPEFDPIVAQN